jgi:hypothetical protein
MLFRCVAGSKRRADSGISDPNAPPTVATDAANHAGQAAVGASPAAAGAAGSSSGTGRAVSVGTCSATSRYQLRSE